MSLEKYHKKRDFKLTPEPYGQTEKKHKNLLYLIQKHAASHLHYDLRLEMNGVLKSWAVPKGPSLDPSVKRLAVHVEDHPINYGSFEGIIPAGQYGGGTVLLWDTGEWECQDSNVDAAYKKGHLTFLLKGKKLKGVWKLIRLKNDPKNWLLIKEKDNYSQLENAYNILEEKPNSVKSKCSLEQITQHYNKTAKKLPKKSADKIDRMPTMIRPELAILVDKPPIGNKWLHEIKLDGYRIITFIQDKKINLITRNQNDWTEKFPDLKNAIKKLKLNTAILDGELVALNADQHTDFQLLQNSIHNKDTASLIYYVFDLLYFNGKDLTSLPLQSRKKQLQQLLPSSTGMIRYSDHIIGKGAALFKKSCQLSLEGIVSKNINSVYEQKRTHNWVKTKCIKRQEFIVAGFTQPRGKRDYFGALLLGVYVKNDQLHYCGNVGTGFTEDSLKNIGRLLKKYQTPNTPFSTRPMPKSSGKISWVEPKIIVEVEFTEWTREGSLRHPSFKGIRHDKAPQDIIQEKPSTTKLIKKIASTNMTKNPKRAEVETEMNYPFTHPDKILYPEQEITKLDLANYYHNIHAWILPYIAKRPLTLVRCPQGTQNKCFFQKHLNDLSADGLYSIDIKDKTGIQPYLYIKDENGLLALVQFSVLEMHVWGCHIKNVEKPDFITFDLDPGPHVEWKKVIESAYFIKENLEKIKLTSFVKTTGGKGLHVVVPIKPQYGWDEIEIFAHTFVDYLVSLNPKLYIANMSKAKRIGKIFLDYLRNQRGATAVVPYSTRAKENAPVSTPLAWEELTTKIRSDSFTIKNIITRLKNRHKDPWEEFFNIKQGLKLPNIK